MLFSKILCNCALCLQRHHNGHDTKEGHFRCDLVGEEKILEVNAP